MIKSSAITNQLSITVTGLIINYLFTSDSSALGNTVSLLLGSNDHIFIIIIYTFLFRTAFLRSSFKHCYMQYHAIMKHVNKRFLCTKK